MIKYLCIDDEGAEVINPILANLSTAHNDLNIVHERPKNFSDQIEELQATMGQQKYHGLILDLRLDMFKSPEGEKANYRAFALAQEIRTRVTEGKLNDFPIVLCSVHTRIRRSYASDDTSHDLYDAVYEKENIPDNAAVIANELVSLVKGYRFIRKQLDGSRPPFYKMILADSEAGNALNPSVLSMFDKKRPVHEYARFILNELIRIPGPLIDERILVARLGIDIKKSTDWEKLKSALSRLSAYRGAFSDGWQRWWSAQIEDWWKSLRNSPGPLSRIPATERVDFIKKAMKLKNLIPASTIELGYSNRFWTICRGYNLPLDPVDGFLMEEDRERKIWQDKAYISIKAALERKDGLKVHAIDRDRFEAIKKARK